MRRRHGIAGGPPGKPAPKAAPASALALTLTSGVAAHRAGKIAEALSSYDRVLGIDPRQPDALNLSGLLLVASGRVEEGVARIAAAVEARPDEASLHVNLIRELAQNKRWAEATAAAMRFAEKLPEAGAVTGALLALANALYDAGRQGEAVPLYARAEALGADGVEAPYNRGCCLRDLNRLEEAAAAFRAALRRNPELASGYVELAALARRLGDRPLARLAARAGLMVAPAHPDFPRILATLPNDDQGRAPHEAKGDDWLARLVHLDPNAADAPAIWAARLSNAGRPGAAARACRRALTINPAIPSAWVNFGPILAAQGGAAQEGAPHRQAEEGRVAAARACRLAPDDAAAWLNRGMLAHAAHDRDLAAACARRVVMIDPAAALGWVNLGAAANAKADHRAALNFLDRAVSVGAPDAAARAHSNRGVALMAVARTTEAVAAFRAALALRPDDAATRSNLLFCLCFDPDIPPEEAFAEHRAFERLLPRPGPLPTGSASPASTPAAPHDGRLRIGYVSPDFQRYPGPGFHFLTPLLGHHDRGAFHVAAYYTDTVRDGVTATFRGYAETWRDAAGASDEALAALVAADGIDILVDCDGHMSRNRMTAFARRMAPLQVSFPLYPNTTGLDAMDYQFGDPRLTPGWMAAFRTEALVRLPGSVLCYHPTDDDYAPPPAAPWESAGVVTFASFNNPAKLDDATFAAWSAILNAAPRTRLMFKWRGLAVDGTAVDGTAGRASEGAERIRARFAAHGVAAERLILRGAAPDPYSAYAGVDLCLDPLFAAGGTTTCDALWTGTPVLTLPGRTVIGRWGLSLLWAVGLDGAGLAADSPADYVDRAAALARDPSRLSELRRGLRERVAASPLMDAAAYTRGIETAYGEMWRRHRAGLPPEPFDVAADGAIMPGKNAGETPS